MSKIDNKQKIECALSNVTMSSEAHKMIIRGCITKIGSPSTGAPCGANGKLAVFTQESIDACAKSFVGMPLNCTYPEGIFADGVDMFTGHGDTNIGYIRKVKAEGDNLMAEMVVWKDKFPSEAYMIVNGADALGFSVEWYATQTHEDEQNLYMDEFEGIGCALLWKNCAAFSDTFIEKLAAAHEKESDNNMSMTKEEKDALISEIGDAIVAGLAERFEGIDKAQAEVKASIDEVKAQVEAQKAASDEIKASVEAAKADIEAGKAEVEAMKAEQVKAEDEQPEEIPAPKAGQHVEPSPIEAGADDKANQIAKIKASNMTLAEQVKAITKIRLAK